VRSREGIPGTVVTPGSAGMREHEIDDNEWPLIATFAGVVGQGKNNVTPLPIFDSPVLIPSGSKQAFYVTTTLANAAVDMWYSGGSTLEGVYASDANIEILEGHAVGSQSGYMGWSSPRRWNGIVHYAVVAEEATSSPSQMVSRHCLLLVKTKIFALTLTLSLAIFSQAWNQAACHRNCLLFNQVRPHLSFQAVSLLCCRRNYRA